MAQQNIQSGNAPIIWSTVDEAFQKINSNFTELYLSIGGSGTDLTNLNSSVIPSTTEIYDLGSANKRWKDLYLSGSSLHLGSAVITSAAGAVNLPAGSSIGGSILDQEYFKTIAVAGQSDIVADSGGNDVLTFAAGSGVSLTTDASTDTLTISNSGVLSAVAGTGIGVSGSTGNVTFSNTGVLSVTAGSGISISAPSGNLTVANTGVLSVTTFTGSGIQINTVSPGVFEFVNTLPNTNQNTFRQIAVAGQTVVQADDPADTLTLANGSGIDITTNGSTDTITIENTGVTSLAVTAPGLSITGATGSLTLANTGVVAISAGSGIGINTSTGTVVVSNTRFGFTNIAVSGQNPIQADNTTDTLTLIADDGVVLTTNETNDSLTIGVDHLIGNVYSETSTLLVNASLGKIVGDVDTDDLRLNSTFIALGLEAGLINQNSIGSLAIGYRAGRSNQAQGAVAVGYDAGQTNQGGRAVAIGDGAGDVSQGYAAVAIGTQAGQNNQGAYSISIGGLASDSNQSANSIVINATGSNITAAAAGLYVAPIREVTGPQVLYYNPSDKEITWGPIPSGGGSGGGGDFELNVAGDDSTIRRIFSGETLKFVGASGITTATDGEGQVTITGPSLATVATSGSYLDLTNQPSIPAAYSVTSIDALSDVDTSTTPPTNGQSLVWSTASSKWLPSTVTGGGGSLQSRSNVGTTTTSLANGATGNITITGYKGYMMYKIQTSAAAWVRVYTDVASRTADSSRAEGVDPAPGSGVIAEVITTGAQTILLSPGTIGFSNEGTPSTNIECAVTNKSGGTTTITVTLTVVQLEA